MKNVLVLIIALASISIFAEDNLCKFGFSCEKTSDNQFVLRETTLIKDESLDLCQTYTIANFGTDENACLDILDRLNSI